MQSNGDQLRKGSVLTRSIEKTPRKFREGRGGGGSSCDRVDILLHALAPISPFSRIWPGGVR